MSDDIAILCGGLGGSQLVPEILATAQSIFGPDNVWHGDGSNDYLDSGEIWEFINDRPASRVFFVGHSLGVDQVVSSAILLWKQSTPNRCIGLVALDAVLCDKPDPQCSTLSIHADNSFPFPQANVAGSTGISVFGTNHNSLPHHPDVIAAIVQHIQSCRAS